MLWLKPSNYFCHNIVGRPHHWVTPFLGKCGQIDLSRHNFASTAPFPDLSTPLDSLNFSSYHGGLGVETGAVVEGNFRKMVCYVGRVRAVSHSQPQTPSLRCLQMCKIGPHILCGFGRGKLSRWAVHSKGANVMQRFGHLLPTHTLDWLHFKFPRFDLIARNPQTWSGLKACMCCGDIALPVFGPLSATGSSTEHTFPTASP